MNLPNDVRLEKLILSSALLFPNALEELTKSTEPIMFFNVYYRRVAERLIEACRRGEKANIAVLLSELGEEYSEVIISISNDSHPMRDIERYTKRLNDMYIARELVTKCHETINMANSHIDDYEDFILATRQNFEIVPVMKKKSELKHITSWRASAIKEWEDSRKGIAGIKCGMPVFDDVTGGFRAGEYIVVAARPGCGKTSLSLTIAVGAAMLGNNVDYYSIEMRGEEVFNKVTSVMSKDYDTCFPYRLFRGIGLPSKEQFETFKAVQSHMDNIPLNINDYSQTSLDDLTSELREKKRKGKLGLVIIDYISLIKGQRGKKRWEMIQEFSMTLKALFRELECPGIVISQLRRDLKSKPTMDDLRESGQVEQDADMIFALHQPFEDRKDIRELLGLKGRNVGMGDVYLDFCTETTKVGGTPIQIEEREVEDESSTVF